MEEPARSSMARSTHLRRPYMKPLSFLLEQAPPSRILNLMATCRLETRHRDFLWQQGPQEIRQALLCEAQAGVTMLHADTGLRRTPGSVVFCVIPNKKLYGVKAAIRRIDPGAFLTIAAVREVQGQGFTAARIPLSVGK